MVARLIWVPRGWQMVIAIKFTLEWYEKWSDAIIILTLGSNNFSFTDSPKQGAGPNFPEIAAVPYSNSSLILDGVFDLSAATAPLLQYYTYYELGGNAVVEGIDRWWFQLDFIRARAAVPHPAHLQAIGAVTTLITRVPAAKLLTVWTTTLVHRERPHRRHCLRGMMAQLLTSVGPMEHPLAEDCHITTLAFAGHVP